MRHLFHIYEGFDGEMYRLGDMIKDERFRSQINGRKFLHFLIIELKLKLKIVGILILIK